MAEPRFPVLYPHERHPDADTWRGCPATIPWSLVAPHEQQAHANHGQSLRQLASRGGLSPDELFAVMHDRRWHLNPRPLPELRAWLLALPTQAPQEGEACG